jgi:monoamine oxidase
VAELDVVIVGAGLAGLNAARRLVDEGAAVTVVEARDRVGGRVLNHELADGTIVELGGEFVGPTQTELRTLAAEMGVETFPTYDEGEDLLYNAGRVDRYKDLPPLTSTEAERDLTIATGRFESLAVTVDLESPWRTPDGDILDAHSVRAWAQQNLETAEVRALIRTICLTVFAEEPDALSLLHFVWYLKSAGGLFELLGTRGGAQDARFVGGSQLVPIRLAERLGAVVQTGTPVRRISQNGEGVTVETGDASSISAKYAIVTTPPPLTARLDFDPLLPLARRQLVQRQIMGAGTKVMAVYDEPFWRADGLTGQAAGGPAPINGTFDNSPLDGSCGIILGFIEGRHASDYWSNDAESRRELVAAALGTLYGPAARTPSEIVEHEWADEEWSRGCLAHMPPGVWTAYGPAMREPVGRLHWSSSEASTIWAGYMDGAVRSGVRAADEVLARL